MVTETLKSFVDATQNLEYILLDAQRKFEKQVTTLIKIMQEGVGYVAFNDDSGYVAFYDFCIDETRQIMAVRVITEDGIDRIEIMTDDNFDEEFKDGWFKYHHYGRLDMGCLFDALKNNLEID